MDLKEFFAENKKVAMGFSGGVDSAFLLYSGLKYGADIKPYFVKTCFQPQFELCDAEKLSQNLGVELTVLNVDILDNDDIRDNAQNRCYFCKKRIFTEISSQAKLDGYDVLIDGTNASDDISDRPGAKALLQLKVLSPLKDAGLTKERIRYLSKEAGLFTWNKPAYACLATRIKTGLKIDVETLENVEKAEKVLHKMGFTDMRVRVKENTAQIHIKEEEMDEARKKKSEIFEKVSGIFPCLADEFEGR